MQLTLKQLENFGKLQLARPGGSMT